MQWKVKVEAIVKRVETIDYDIEAKTGDEARAKVLELFKKELEKSVLNHNGRLA